MKTLIIITTLLISSMAYGQCTNEEYKRLITEAEQAKQTGLFDLAIKKLSSARVCRPEYEDEVNKLLLQIYDEVNKQREIAIRSARITLANSIATSSKELLRNGDRTKAMRVAEIAYKYIDSENSSVAGAILESVYHNEKNRIEPIYWYSKFNRERESILNVSTTGQYAVTIDDKGNITNWDVLSGNALVDIPGEHAINESLFFSSVKYSENDSLLVTISDSKMVTVWDLVNGKNTFTYSGIADSVLCIAISKDNRKLAVSMSDNTAIILNLDSNEGNVILNGHSAGISHMVFSPDGETVATASDDSTIKIWSTISGEVLKTITPSRQHGGFIALEFAPDGNSLASIGFLDSAIDLWDSTTGETQMSLTDQVSVFVALAFSSDGNKIVAGNLNGDVTIWNMFTGQEISRFSVGDDGISKLSFCKDDTRITCLGFMRSVLKIWHLDHPSDATILNCGNERVWDLAFSTNGDLLATAGWKNYARVNVSIENAGTDTLKSLSLNYPWGAMYAPDSSSIVWNLNDSILVDNTGRLGRRYSIIDSVLSIAFSQDSKKLITGNVNGVVSVFDIKTGELNFTINASKDSILCVAFSADAGKFATASADKQLRIWDSLSLDTLLSVTEPVPIGSLAFSNSGETIAIGILTGVIKILNTLSGKTERLLNTSNSPIDVSFTKSDDTLQYGILEGSVAIWNFFSGKKVLELPCTQNVIGLAFSPSENELAISIYDNVQIWDLTSQSKTHDLVGHSESIFDLDYSPNGKMLVSAAGDSTAILWDVDSGTELRRFRGHQGIVYSATFSPDGMTIATGSWDRTAKMWDVNTGQLLKNLVKHRNRVNSVEFSNDGKRLAVTSSDGQTSIWSSKTGIEIATLQSGENAVAFSREDKWLAMAFNEMVVIWDMNSNSEVATLEGHSESVHKIAFSPTSDILATAAWDKTTKIWYLNIDEWKRGFETDGISIALTSKDIDELKIYQIMDIPGVEQSVLQTEEVWQLSAFAEYFANQVKLSTAPDRIDYLRAIKFYEKCKMMNVANNYFNRAIRILEEDWRLKTN